MGAAASGGGGPVKSHTSSCRTKHVLCVCVCVSVGRRIRCLWVVDSWQAGPGSRQPPPADAWPEADAEGKCCAAPSASQDIFDAGLVLGDTDYRQLSYRDRGRLPGECLVQCGGWWLVRGGRVCCWRGHRQLLQANCRPASLADFGQIDPPMFYCTRTAGGVRQ